MTELEALDLQLKQLEVQKRTEEINQLRNAGKVRWVTPAALAAFLPLVLWALTMAKDYTAGIRALNENEGLKQQRTELNQQKADLNQEIVALLALKQHYREEVRARQDVIDATYLRGKFTGDELSYALTMMQGVSETNSAELSQLRAYSNQVPASLRSAYEQMLSRQKFSDDMFRISAELVKEFLGTFDLVKPSEWTKAYSSTLSGQLASNRRLMVAKGAGVTSYYDVDLGRVLTAEEARSIK